VCKRDQHAPTLFCSAPLEETRRDTKRLVDPRGSLGSNSISQRTKYSHTRHVRIVREASPNHRLPRKRYNTQPVTWLKLRNYLVQRGRDVIEIVARIVARNPSARIDDKDRIQFGTTRIKERRCP
jgi:hypothetical protein